MKENSVTHKSKLARRLPPSNLWRGTSTLEQRAA